MSTTNPPSGQPVLAGKRAPSRVFGFAVLVGLAYGIVAALSLNLVHEAKGIAVLWPAAGIAAGAVTLAWRSGRIAVLGAIVLGGLAANLWSGNGLARSLVFMAANTGETALFAWGYLRLTGGAASITRGADVLRLVLAALGACAAAGLAGSLGLAATGQAAMLSNEGWLLWTAADLAGVLTFAPVFLARWTWGERRREAMTLDILAAAGAGMVAWVILAVPVLAGSVVRDVPLAAMLPMLLWIGIRRSIPGAAWSALAIASVTALTTIAEIGLFGAEAQLDDPVAVAQVLMATCALALLTLATVFDERRQARRLLDTTEERQRVAIEGAGAASWDIDLRTGKGVWSPAHYAFLGLELPPDGVGDRETWRARIHPADLAMVDAAFEASLDGRTPYQAEHRIIRADTGEVRWLSGFGRILHDAAGLPSHSVGIILDVTARHDGKRIEAFLLRLEDAMRGLHDAAAVERVAAEMLGREIGAGRVFYACIDAERFGTVGPNYTDGMEPISGRFDVEAFSAAVLETHLRGETLVIGDAATHPGIGAGELAAFAQIGVRSAITANLRKNSRWIASMAAQRPEPHHWTSGEITLLEAVAERTWTAVERVHAERALVASEQRFRALFDEAAVGMVLMDAGGTTRRVNATYTRIVARPMDAILGHSPLDLTHPDDVSMQREKVAAVASGTQPSVVFEKRYLQPDGTVVWVRSNVSRMADGDLLAVVEDISSRVAAEAELRRLADAMPAFVYRTLPDGQVFSINRRWSDYTGQTLEDARAHGAMNVVHPDDAVATMDAFLRAAERRERYVAEFRCRRHDGEYRWFYAVSEPAIGADGELIEWLGTATDIHDRKLAEAAEAAQDRRNGFLLRLQDRTRSLDTPGEVAIAAAAMLGEEIGAGRVLYGELDEAAQIGTVERNWLAGMPDAVGRYPLDDFGLALETLRAGQQMVVADVMADVRTARHCARPDLAPLGIGATLDTPLLRDGRLVGLLAVQTAAPRVWTEDEAALAAEVADRTWGVMERLRVQTALRLKTEEVESLVLSAPVGLAFFDRDHRYLRINDELAETNGAAAADHIGVTLEVMRPEIAAPIGRLIDAVFADGTVVRDLEISGEVPGRPGTTRHWLSNFYPVRAADGRITQVGVWAIDITARKSAEQALRNSEARLRAVIEAVPVGLIFAEASGRITGGNTLVEALVGHPVLPSAAVDDYREWVSFHPDGRQVEGREYPLALALAGEPRPELEVLYHRGDGHDAWLRFVAAPIRNEAGGIAGGVVAALDIDRERRVEAELRELNVGLERRVADAVSAREAALAQLHEAQKMEAVGQLTGGVAHDFNNLLAAILSNLDLARKHATDARMASLIEGAVRGAERGAALTKRLLAFARRQDLRAERVELDGLVAGMTDLLARTLGPGVRVTVALPAGLPAVLADPGQLELAVLNLAVNARDAMPGGGMLTVEATAETIGPGPGIDAASGAATGLVPGAYVRLAVTDTGHGMDDATRARATEPFFTTKGPGRGTGLGLSMVQGLAAQSGGAMRIDSAPGRGTTVALWLPQAEAGAQKAAGAATDRATDAVPAVAPDTVATDADVADVWPAARRRVLVVDDDILVAMGTVAMLEDLGHEVLEAHSGPAALAILATETGIDLVVTDHAMPGMTGAELARAIREADPGMPILLATGYAELPRGHDPGLPRLAKPFRQIELDAAIRDLMR